MSELLKRKRRVERCLSLSANQKHIMNSLADINGVVKVNVTMLEGLVLTTSNGDTIFESVTSKAPIAIETYVEADADGDWFLILVE